VFEPGSRYFELAKRPLTFQDEDGQLHPYVPRRFVPRPDEGLIVSEIRPSPVDPTAP
jgi:hypothetical protein